MTTARWPTCGARSRILICRCSRLPAARADRESHRTIVKELLRARGAKRVSLTVTASNSEAIQLYQRCGFEEVRRFFAYVWDRG